MGSNSKADTVMPMRSASEQKARAPISPSSKEQGAVGSCLSTSSRPFAPVKPSKLRISTVRDSPEPSQSASVVAQTQQRASSSRLKDPLPNRLTGVKVLLQFNRMFPVPQRCLLSTVPVTGPRTQDSTSKSGFHFQSDSLLVLKKALSR